MTKVIHWNGVDMPDELRSLPAGTYVIEAVDDALTPEEEQGLVVALASVRSGKGIDHETARDGLRARLRK